VRIYATCQNDEGTGYFYKSNHLIADMEVIMISEENQIWAYDRPKRPKGSESIKFYATLQSLCYF